MGQQVFASELKENPFEFVDGVEGCGGDAIVAPHQAVACVSSMGRG